MKQVFLFTFSVLLIFSSGCEKSEPDQEKPEIDLTVAGAFPNNCDTIYFGQTFSLKLRLTDNVELGSLSIDIHHNFDHHNHSTEINPCVFDPIKTPVNPLVFTRDFSIADGSTDVIFTQEILLPLGDAIGDYDTGDYHFFISLTDKSGWSVQKGLSVKILK
ncbi:MAG: DUF4625 domain-containing protein [Bacteroidales bacterium]|nr:DUF4625 domain-containing protein [Bacteroidales bacterium]